MKIILISTLYPNSLNPARALCNQQHFEAIRALGHEVEVIDPIPWFPGKRGLPPLQETLNGIDVHQPRFFAAPGIHHRWKSYQQSVENTLEEVIGVRTYTENVHIILGFTYPDAVAMAPVCKEMELDYSVFVPGSDFHIRTRQHMFRKMVVDALKNAPMIFCPGQALKRDMIAAGIQESKIFPFKNGVNHAIFHDRLPESADPPSGSILFVGNLVDVKTPERLIRGFAGFIKSQNDKSNMHPDEAEISSSLQLDIVGDGPLRRNLVKLCRRLGIAERVRFHGQKSPPEIAEMMQKASCLGLCSRSEGMPDVVIEALACGCPVIAAEEGEVPFLITDGVNGLLVPVQDKTEEQIAQGISQKLAEITARSWNRSAISAQMTPYTWEHAAQIVMEVISKNDDNYATLISRSRHDDS